MLGLIFANSFHHVYRITVQSCLFYKPPKDIFAWDWLDPLKLASNWCGRRFRASGVLIKPFSACVILGGSSEPFYFFSLCVRVQSIGLQCIKAASQRINSSTIKSDDENIKVQSSWRTGGFLVISYRWPDSNRHDFRRQILSLLCLPIPPQRQISIGRPRDTELPVQKRRGRGITTNLTLLMFHYLQLQVLSV